MYTPPAGYFPRTLPHGLGATSALAVGSSAASSAAAIGAAAAWIPAAAVPFIGPAIAGVSLAIEAILNSGCGQSCVMATQFANQFETQLQNNLAAYMALSTPRPYVAQQAALANFDQFWAYLVQQCGNPQLGSAGQRCISERQRGGKYDAFTPFRDPIANDPNVAPPIPATTALVNSAVSSFGIDTSAWPAWWPIAVVGLIVAVVEL
jgi:hypothetical protein